MINIPYVVEVFIDMLPVLPFTLYLTLIPFFLSLILGLILAILIHLKIPVFNEISRVFVSFYRGTPQIGQLFLIYFGVPMLSSFFKDLDRNSSFMIMLTLNSSAYVCESFRGAFLSVEKGQKEAGEMIGLTTLQIMRNIVIPQAIPIAMPTLVSILIDDFKSSSVAFTIGITDITAVAKIVAGRSFQYFESYLAMLLLYWIVVIILEQIQKFIAKKVAISY